MDPNGDHGVGAAFLRLFAVAAAKEAGQQWPVTWTEKIEQRIRHRVTPGHEDAEQAAFAAVGFEEACYVRNSVRFVDVVVSDRRDHFLVIENKIRQDSKTNGQLKEQYEAFRLRLANEKADAAAILMVYLVPARWDPDAKRWSDWTDFEVELEFERRPRDGAAILTWQPVVGGRPSVVSLLRELLRLDREGEISPLPHETRLFIQSFIHFALKQFAGVRDEWETGPTPPDKDRIKARQLLDLAPDTELYVGVQHGLTGLISRSWRNPGFLDADLNVARSAGLSWQYLSLAEFKAVARWAMAPEAVPLQGLSWEGRKLPTNSMYRVAKSLGPRVAVGMKGGFAALKAAQAVDLSNRMWSVADSPQNAQWFTGDQFCSELEAKGLRWD